MNATKLFASSVAWNKKGRRWRSTFSTVVCSTEKLQTEFFNELDFSIGLICFCFALGVAQKVQWHKFFVATNF